MSLRSTHKPSLKLTLSKTHTLSNALKPLPPARTFSSLEDTDASLSSIVDLIPPQGGVTPGFDPHPGHGVIEDLVLFELPQTGVVDQNAAVLAAPDLVAPDRGVAARANLDPRVKVVEDLVVFQLAVAAVVEIDADLGEGE